jgi:ribose transport system ATP-binding protein
MRDGAIIGTDYVNNLNENKIKSMMVGREFIEGGEYYRKDLNYIDKNNRVFKVENLIKKGFFYDINFELKRGEILGIGGLSNCGMHELGKVLFGIENADSGKVILYRNGKEIEIIDTTSAMKNKIAYLPKNRDQESIMLTSSIMDNIVLPGLDLLTKATFIRPHKSRRYAEKNTKQLSIKMNSIDQLVMYLSGGNKQKVAISKWLANGSKIFILDCPTRGIDIAVKAAIYGIMRDFASKGYSFIMISEELPELIGMSDRIIIIRKGGISTIVKRGENYEEEYLINYMI